MTPGLVASSQTVTVNQGVAKAITLASTDPNGDPLTFQVTAGPSSGTLTGSGASRIYTPNAGFSGSDSFQFTATDTATGLVSNTGTVSITVTPPPVASSQLVTANQGVAKAITLASTDPNGDPLTFQVTAGPSSGTLTGSGASRTYTSNSGFSGSDSFAYTATDTATGLVSNTATVSITVMTPAAVSWTGNAGTLNWGDANNWSNDAVPTSADDVTINMSGVGTITVGAGNYAVGSLNDTTAGLSIASGGSLSIAGAVASTFGQNVTVQSGGTLAVGAGASVAIGENVTLTDDGTLSFATGDAVALNIGTTQIVVGSGGLMTTASGDSFSGSTSYSTQIVVNSGGHLQASNSSFALNNVTLNTGSILNAGDFTGNSFNSPLFLPESDVQYLSGTGSNNAQFEDIDILAGSVASGQTLALNAIGTASTANLRYVFDGNFMVSSGATVTVGPNVSVLIQENLTLTDDGTLSFATGDAVALNIGTTQIVVGSGGLMTTASGDSFSGSTNYSTQIVVNSGGHLQASNSSFALNNVTLNTGSILNAGDFTGNSFNSPLFLPESDVQYLSGTGSNNAQFEDIDILAGSVASGQTLALNAIGTASTANLRYVFDGNFMVSSGATVTVGPNVSVLIQENLTLTDDGTLSFATGDAVALNIGTTQIVVGSGGLMTTASGDSFSGSTNYSTQIVVNSGGHLQASNSSFALNNVTLNTGSILNAGDFTGNSFNSPLFLPESDVQYLSGTGSNNAQFEDIDILAGSVASGQTLALNAIGTASTANLRYVFDGNFMVSSGATVTVGPNVSVLIQENLTLTDDGTLSFATGDAVALNIGTTQIVVGSGGLMTTASGDSFSGSTNYSTQIVVNSGGHLQASNSSFALNNVTLNTGSILNAGDFTGNSFNSPLFLPESDVQYLSGTGSNNAQFEDIDILAGSVASGQTLALNAIGTASTANLRYVFDGNFMVSSGATVTVGPNVSVLIQENLTLTDDGTLSFATGDAVALNIGTTQIVVGSGGLMTTASGDSFSGSTNYSTQIVVNSGGHLQASNSSFALNNVTLNTGSILNAGDFTGNSFNSPLFLPESDVQYLSGTGSNNAQFEDIDILAGSVASGQTLALNAIGTASTASLRYVFDGNFMVSSGATVTVGPNVSVLIQENLTLTDDGTLSFATGDAVALNIGTTQIVVGSGGLMTTASGDSFSGSTNYATQIVVNSGGHLQASNSSFALNNVTLNSGSTDTIQFSSFATQLAINSGATIDITSDDFTNGTVVASGDPNATISMTDNFWGTLNTTQIAAKITDHTKNSSLPTVLYQPFLSEDATGNTASNATATFSTASQSVALSATVISAAGLVNTGTETFTVLNGSAVVGTPVTSNVVNGVANAEYALPASTPGGIYTIQAVYSGTSSLLGSSDSSHSLTISNASTNTAAASAATTFSVSAQTVALIATVTSAIGIVNEGQETFTILSGNTVNRLLPSA